MMCAQLHTLLLWSAFVCFKEEESDQMINRSIFRSFGSAYSGMLRFVTAISVARLSNEVFMWSRPHCQGKKCNVQAETSTSRNSFRRSLHTAEGGRIPLHPCCCLVTCSQAHVWVLQSGLLVESKLDGYWRQGLEDVINVSITHPTWQKTKPDDPGDAHSGCLPLLPPHSSRTLLSVLRVTRGAPVSWLMQSTEACCSPISRSVPFHMVC